MKGFSHKVGKSSPCDFTQADGFSHKVLRLPKPEGFSHKVLNIYTRSFNHEGGEPGFRRQAAQPLPLFHEHSKLVQHRQAMFHQLACSFNALRATPTMLRGPASWPLRFPSMEIVLLGARYAGGAQPLVFLQYP